MPFTFSHVAVVLPFIKNNKLSATALIAGSMSPDFEYFFRMKMQSEISHTFLGIFLIDFPLGFIVMFAFHQIIKKPLIENAPIFFQKRLHVVKESNWILYFKNNIFIVFISFFLGAISHVLWDSMTHWNGFMVQYFSFFNATLYSLPVYKLGQYGSSIIGLIVILFFVYKLPEEYVKSTKINLNYWFCTLFFAVVLIAMRFYFGSELNKIGNAIVSVISPIVIAVVLSGLLFRDKKNI